MALSKEEKLARQRVRAAKWRAKNRDKIRAYDQAYMAVPENREARDAANRRFHERRLAAATPRPQMLCFGRHPGRKKEAAKRYRDGHRKSINERIALSKAAKPDLYRQHAVQVQATRRARLRGAIVERVSVTRIYARDGHRCHLCGGDVAKADRSIDHLIPISRGGAHAEWNLMLAHLRCNQRRHTRRVLAHEDRATAEAYIAEKTGRTVAA